MEKDNMKQYVPTDIRLRDWMTLDTRVSHILRLLIETENILIELDDYQREHNQCYEDLEDFNLKLFVYRHHKFLVILCGFRYRHIYRYLGQRFYRHS